MTGSFWDYDKSDFGKKKGLVVIHEFWGLTDTIREQAELIAKRGNFTVVAPDMFRGWLCLDVGECRAHFAQYNWAAGLQDVKAAVKFLKSKGCGKVGITLSVYTLKYFRYLGPSKRGAFLDLYTNRPAGIAPVCKNMSPPSRIINLWIH